MPQERPKTVLVIDNDDDIVRMTRMLLESHGYECVTAVSGAQGIREFAACAPDVVVTDLNMPSGDGVSLIRSIRRSSLAPIIVVSGFRNEYAERVRHLSNVTLLTKPFDSQALLDLIEVECAA